MTWTRLSDDFADHPDLLAASRSARLLFVEALVYCNRHGNDGRFRRGLTARMTDAEDWPILLDELLELGLVDTDGDVMVIDWKAWAQEPAAAVRERRDANAEANRLYRERGRRHRAGDHSLCTSKCPDKKREQSRDRSRETSRDGSRDPYPSPPVPSGGKGEGGDRRRPASAGAPAPGPALPGATPYQLGIEPTVTVDGKPQ